MALFIKVYMGGGDFVKKSSQVCCISTLCNFPNTNFYLLLPVSESVDGITLVLKGKSSVELVVGVHVVVSAKSARVTSGILVQDNLRRAR